MSSHSNFFPFPFVLIWTTFTFAISQSQDRSISIRDFRRDEVKVAGFILQSDTKIHISALGGGEKSFWRDWDDDDRDPQMFARGWIINADTRKPEWEMTMENTRGRSDEREIETDIQLKRGSYELYFAASTYFRGGSFSHSSINIDRRKGPPSYGRVLNSFLRIFGSGDSRELDDDFMDLAKRYGVTISMKDDEPGVFQRFDAPKANARSIFSAVGLGDQAVVRKSLRLSKDLDLRIFALGEGRQNDELFDHGWIIRLDTRERIWEMKSRDVSHAGGAQKNIAFDRTVRLPKGSYELMYVTDDSHSNDDWNTMPPFDPFNYGLQVLVVNEADRSAIVVSDVPTDNRNVIVNLTRVRDNEFRSAGFLLNRETKLHIYALGEGPEGYKEMVDRAWIVNAKTKEKVWSMDRRRTFHAGGATKNRLADEILALPKGSYIAYVETDGSHAYNAWNADPPFDPDHWGLTIKGGGEQFDPKSVGTFDEEKEEGVITQLVRVRDSKHEHARFILNKPTTVRIYALGEGQDRTMYDYGWIENVSTGQTVWEMTYRMTSNAGGGKKNRMVNTTLMLEKGEYELHYRSDDSHSFND